MKVICSHCGREVNGYIPSVRGDGATLYPRRHLPPSELGRGSHRHSDGTTSWFGAERWCMGGYYPARKRSGAAS